MRRGLFLLGLIAMVGVAAAAAAISRLNLPDPQEHLQTSYICAGNVGDEDCTADNAMAQLSDDANRTYVPLEEMPQHLIHAVVAVEDRSFFEHQGVSAPAIARAVYQDFLGGGVQQGGSTITQQYIKNVYLNDERTFDRKIREAVLAMKLEQQTPKEEILEGYLNTIWLGRQSIGVQGASRVYFDKDVQDLEVHESALLAGLIRAPESADPANDPEEAERRRELALTAMFEEGYISQEEMDFANAVGWDEIAEFDSHKKVNTLAGTNVGTEYVTQYIRAQLKEEPFNYTEEEIGGGGLRVYTSLNMDLQTAAYETIYNDVLTEEGDPAGSLVSVDDQGRVVAMVGGRNYDENYNNLATAGRAVGSTYKPVALAAAVQEGYSLTNSTLNSPGRFEAFYAETNYERVPGCGEGEGDEWSVGNYSDTEHEGRMNLVDATAASSNTAYAQIMMELGPERVWETATDLGLPLPKRPDGSTASPDEMCPPTVLGTENASALQMAGAFSTFANRGHHFEPQIITKVERVDADGNVEVDWEDDAEERKEQVLTPEKSDLVTHSLRQVLEGDRGTAEDAQIEGWQAAGKTGTTSNNKDAWFVGYVPGFTTSVWMGHPDADSPIPGCDVNNLQEGQPEDCLQITPMNDEEGGVPVHGTNVTGGSFPAEIWQKYMTRALADQEPRPFTEPTPEQLAEGEILGQEAPAQPAQPPPSNEPPPDSVPDTSMPEISIPQGPDLCQRPNPPDYCGDDGGGDDDGGGNGGGGDDDGAGVDCSVEPWHPDCMTVPPPQDGAEPVPQDAEP